VRVSYDKDAKTLTIADNGIGLSEQEAIDNLGTIAKSGTREFMGKLSGDQKVGRPADRPVRRGLLFGLHRGRQDHRRIAPRGRPAAGEGVRWTSGGTGDFEVETIERAQRGTSVTLHLRDDAQDYLNTWKLKDVIGKYSDHIALPILMHKEEWKEGEEGKGGEMVLTDEWETVNQASALWTRPKKDITDEQYAEFYKAISHDFEAPLAWAHNRVEGSSEYTQLLFIPGKAPFDLWNRDKKAGVKLYVKRVFIMDDAEALMPTYLRFVKGVIDSADLPLNVSRELLQESRDVKAIRDGSTKRVLSMLEDLARQEKEGESDEAKAKYGKFYDRVRRCAERRPGRRLCQPRTPGQAAALCLHHQRHREREPGRLQGPHEGRPGRDLLHHGRHAGRRQKQPAAGSVPQEGH
jgi:molecular chaperone HtpG